MCCPPQLIFAFGPSQVFSSFPAVGQLFALHLLSQVLVRPIPSVCDISWSAVRSFMNALLPPNRRLPPILLSAVFTPGAYVTLIALFGRFASFLYLATASVMAFSIRR